MDQARFPLARDTIDEADLDDLCRWIASGPRLTKGPETEAFEARLAERVGARHAVLVNSGSSANLLVTAALLEMGRLPHRRVVAPAVSWVTTVTPALQLGLDVRLCDCDPVHLGLDLDHLDALLSAEPCDAVIVVHVLGHVMPMAPLRRLCAEHGVALIEDSCEALGTVQDGRAAGAFGAAGSYSFYFGHQISTIEGGAVVTDDADLFDVVKSLRAHGWARDVRPETAAAWEAAHGIDPFQRLYAFYHAGFNCRSTDLNARLGLGQLGKLDRLVAAREAVFKAYRDALSPSFWTQTSPCDRLSSLAFGTVVTNRAAVAEALAAEGIETRPLICGNIGRQPFWTDRFGPAALPRADVVHERGLYLPVHGGMTPDDAATIAASFRRVARPATLS